MAYIRSGNGGGGSQKVAVGTFSSPHTATTISVSCGFKPKKLYICGWSGSNTANQTTYDEDISTTSCIRVYLNSGTGGGGTVTVPNTNNNNSLASIDNDGFTYRGSTIAAYYNLTYSYVAIG